MLSDYIILVPDNSLMFSEHTTVYNKIKSRENMLNSPIIYEIQLDIMAAQKSTKKNHFQFVLFYQFTQSMDNIKDSWEHKDIIHIQQC